MGATKRSAASLGAAKSSAAAKRGAAKSGAKASTPAKRGTGSAGAAKSGAKSKAPPDLNANKRDGDAEVWTLRLYVTGRGERSERALSNLRRLCESNLAAGSYQIEVVDLLKNPELARDDQILAIPTLVRKLPEPMKRIIGDLSNADRALLSLDFPKLKDPAERP